MSEELIIVSLLIAAVVVVGAVVVWSPWERIVTPPLAPESPLTAPPEAKVRVAPISGKPVVIYEITSCPDHKSRRKEYGATTNLNRAAETLLRFRHEGIQMRAFHGWELEDGSLVEGHAIMRLRKLPEEV